MSNDISWTAREAFAVAYCWSEFSTPEDHGSTPETYWLQISERARNECRHVANALLLVAVARSQAVAVLPSDGLREGEIERLKAELDLKSERRVHKILDAVRAVFKRSIKDAARGAA